MMAHRRGRNMSSPKQNKPIYTSCVLTCFILCLCYTVCPTRYRTWHFFHNFTTIEDIATKFEADLPHCVRHVTTS
jgi:hypothetical protein